MEQQPINHIDTDNVVCPYCGYEYDASYEANFSVAESWGEEWDRSKNSLLKSDYGLCQCPQCCLFFDFERIRTITYTTQKRVPLKET